jgi:drug/metabolite transporter (DMT)-like permease
MRFPAAPVWALLAGASMWGVLWYPYRLLAQAGIDGIWSTLVTYGFAFALGVALFARQARALFPLSPLTLLMAAAIGWSNLAYVMGVLEGQVMRVLLLFYLAPLWTVPIARLVLRERLDRRGLVVMALAFAGAMTMLWHPDLGVPWPAERAEWLGLVAGFLFALGNVLVRRLDHLGDVAKSVAIWAGVSFAALVHLAQSPVPRGAAAEVLAAHWPLAAGIALVLVAMSIAIQFGLSRLAANRAIVILLFELVVAAFAAHFLTDERLRPQDWIGGVLIVAASVASGAIRARPGAA